MRAPLCQYSSAIGMPSSVVPSTVSKPEPRGIDEHPEVERIAEKRRHSARATRRSCSTKLYAMRRPSGVAKNTTDSSSIGRRNGKPLDLIVRQPRNQPVESL